MSNEPEAEGLTGLSCWRHDLRVCNASCMAYSELVPEGPDYEYPDKTPRQWAHCMELVNQHRTGKHLVLIARELGKVSKFIEDTQRGNQMVPNPGGFGV